ncbi:Sec61 alpha family protein [Spironucleus salmonicida]|uniref:Sec61 alpha family protein n=1 Tax=Spironucleus salmonicida TaxID=348837 RepID=V6LCR0_9EUKA|nr:Sec61 alpha family protein [Spironucleus salmonicida]|eukprot:EST42237.1 Sec61-alpha [Spironucleus salmonicida]
MSPPSWLKAIEPYTKLIPYVQKAPSTVTIELKMFYTFLCLTVFLLGSQIPLYGMRTTIAKDPVFWLRTIFSSARGSVMELGLGPTMTSGLIVRMCVSAGLLRFNRNDQDETELFGRFQSLVGAAFTIGQAVLYVFTGMYGNFAELGAFNAIAIVLQLSGASIILQMLDHMMEQGWGVGSGQSLFTTAQTCESIIWKTFSFMKIDRGYGTEIEGAIPAAIYMIVNRGNKLEAVKLAFIRHGLPNLVDVISTLVIFFVVVYLQGIRKNIKIVHEQAGDQMQQSYPIKLLYASSTPMMIISTVTQNVFMISQAVWRKLGNNFVTGILGKWQENEQNPGSPYPVGGLAWILAPPYSFRSAIFHPIHTLLHAVIVVTISGFAAKMWVNFSGESAKDVAQNLKASKWIIPGFKRDQEMVRELNRYIPVAAMTGGIILGLLSLIADISGCLVSGSGLLMATTSLVKMYEDYAKKATGAGF